MQTILLEADPIINQAISANWVLTGVVTLFCILLGSMLRNMQSEIKTNNKLISDHQTKLEVHEERLDKHDEKFSDIGKDINKNNEALAAAIVAKIRLLKAL